MGRYLTLLSASILIASLGASGVTAATTRQPSSFHGDFDLLEPYSSHVVAHVVVDIFDSTASRPGSGSIDIRWAPGGPAVSSHGDITEVWFGQQPDTTDWGAIRWAGGGGTLCDRTTGGTSCGPFWVNFNETVDPAFLNYVNWWTPDTWYQIGKGDFVLNYLGPAGKVSVALNGASGPMQRDDSRDFSAIVSGAADQSVYWSVKEANGGSITQDGVYIAPALPGIYTVTATSRADVRASASVRVAVYCGTVASLPSSAIGSSTLAKYEPPDGSAYFGFAFRLWEGDERFGDTRPFAARICDAVDVELAGKTPTTLWVWTATWLDPGTGAPEPFSAAMPDIDAIHTALGPSVVPFLTWTLPSEENATSAPATTKDVASGAYDGYIRQYARDVKRYGQPLLITPVCFEMNGNWWPSCSPKANPDLTPADLVNAWRRVVDIFRQQGVTNVAWVWAPATPLPDGVDWGWDSDWQAYYPGDAYVDWIGSSLFEWGEPSWIDPLYAFGVAHHKPYILAQFGVRGPYTDWPHAQHVAWLTTMLDYIESHPEIKAIIYWNYRGYEDPDWADASTHAYLYNGQVNYRPNASDDDCRLLAGGPDMRSLFASYIANPRYISTVVGR